MSFRTKGGQSVIEIGEQALLEELSRLMDFIVEDDEDPTTGKPSGFINIFANSKDGREVNLLDSTGPKNITNDWNQEIVLGEALIERDLKLKVFPNNLKFQRLLHRKLPS